MINGLFGSSSLLFRPWDKACNNESRAAQRLYEGRSGAKRSGYEIHYSLSRYKQRFVMVIKEIIVIIDES